MQFWNVDQRILSSVGWIRQTLKAIKNISMRIKKYQWRSKNVAALICTDNIYIAVYSTSSFSYNAVWKP